MKVRIDLGFFLPSPDRRNRDEEGLEKVGS